MAVINPAFHYVIPTPLGDINVYRPALVSELPDAQQYEGQIVYRLNDSSIHLAKSGKWLESVTAYMENGRADCNAGNGG